MATGAGLSDLNWTDRETAAECILRTITASRKLVLAMRSRAQPFHWVSCRTFLCCRLLGLEPNRWKFERMRPESSERVSILKAMIR